jgi:hypothetical protein
MEALKLTAVFMKVPKGYIGLSRNFQAQTRRAKHSTKRGKT